MFKPSTSALLALSTYLICSASAQTPHLSPLTTFGPNGDGTIRPGDLSYITTGGTERGIAWNPVTGHVLVASRSDTQVHIIDGATGGDLGTLDMSGLITGGNSSFKINMIAVADDGAIYVSNLSNNDSPPKYNLYRWADESSPQTVIWNGSLNDVTHGTTINVAGYRRYGDTITIRGAGTNTQIMAASRGTNVVVIYPTDDTMLNWQSCALHATNVPAGDMGYGIAFGTNNTFYATQGALSGGPLYRLGFDLGDGINGSITVLQTWVRTNFPGTVSALATSTGSNLLAGVDMIPGADLVRLYDIANAPTLPTFLDRSAFATTNDNATIEGSLVFTTNNIIYALDTDNGIKALTIVPSTAPVAPSVFYLSGSVVSQVGSNATFTASADGTAPLSYQWQQGGTNVAGATENSLTLTSLTVSNAGSYTLVVSNVAGMATSSVVALSINQNSPGVLQLYEPFNYTANQLLTVANPSVTLNGSGNDTSVTAGNLSYTGLQAPVGNSITNGGAGAAVRFPLNLTNSTGNVYWSFILRMNTLGTAFIATNGFIAALYSSTANDYGLRLLPRTNTTAGKFDLGISKVAGNGAWTTSGFSDGQTFFLVARYSILAGAGNDSVALWVNPDPSTFGLVDPPAPTLTATGGTDLTGGFDTFTFRQNTAANTPANLQWDELRVGTGWDVVTPPAPPVAPSLSVTTVSTNAILAWPTNGTTGYALQSMAGLDDPNGWVNVANSVSTNGTNYNVTVPARGSIKLFRLIK